VEGYRGWHAGRTRLHGHGAAATRGKHAISRGGSEWLEAWVGRIVGGIGGGVSGGGADERDTDGTAAGSAAAGDDQDAADERLGGQESGPADRHFQRFIVNGSGATMKFAKSEKEEKATEGATEA